MDAMDTVKWRIRLENNLVTVMRQAVVTSTLGFVFLAFLILHRSAFVDKPWFLLCPLLLFLVAIGLGAQGIYNFHVRDQVGLKDPSHWTFLACNALTLLAVVVFGLAAPFLTWKFLFASAGEGADF